MKWFHPLVLAVAAGACLLTTGCDNTPTGKKAAEEAAEAAQLSAEKAGEALLKGAEAAGEAVSESAKEAREEIEGEPAPAVLPGNK